MLHFSNGDGDSGSPPLVWIFMSRLLFPLSKKDVVNDVDNIESYCFVAEKLICQIVLLCSVVSAVISMGINRRHYFCGDLRIF